jgi:hypothetical protein
VGTIAGSDRLLDIFSGLPLVVQETSRMKSEQVQVDTVSSHLLQTLLLVNDDKCYW